MTQHGSADRSGKRSLQPTVDFVCKPKFCNTMPDIPFDGKFLACPFVPLDSDEVLMNILRSSNRDMLSIDNKQKEYNWEKVGEPTSLFIDYKPTSLEKDHKFDVLCEMDMGINIDLIDPDTYRIDRRSANIDKTDKELLEDESVISQKNQQRKAQHSKIVPWMRKTEYISSEYNRLGLTADRQEIKVGYFLKKNMAEDNMYRDHQSQIDAIDKSFEDAKRAVRSHPTRKGITAVEELPVLPDFEFWKYAFAEVTFDADPQSSALPESLRKVGMESSVIRGMQDEETSEQFVALFAPTVDTIQKRMEDREAGRSFNPETTYEYCLNREYLFNIKNKASAFEEQMFFHERDGVMYFNPIETQVKLTRRRRAGGVKPNSELRVTHRDLDETEIAEMTTRMDKLLNPQKEEAIDEQADDEEKEESGAEEASDNDSDSKKKETSDNEGSEKGSSSGESEKSEKSSSSDSDSD